MSKKTPGRGRPPKPHKLDENLNFGVPTGTVAKVEAYRERERLESRGAACRRIIEAGLKAEGIK